MKVLLLGNPIAGGGEGRAMIERLSRLLDTRGHEVEVFLTERAGHAGERVREIAPDVERLAVVGGDGTLNEVLNGLTDPARVPIAQLPAGTANILAHELGFPREPEGTLELIERGELRHVDLGRVSGKRFLLVVSAGFDALVTRAVRETRRGRLGYLGYARPILRAIRDYQRPELEVTVDDGPSFPCQLLIASNTRNYGGLFSISDDARCDSGHLEIVAMPSASIPRLLKLGLGAMLRPAAEDSGARHLKCRRLWIDSQQGVPVQVDGDYYGTTPVEIELEPRVVPVLVPARKT